MHLFAGPWSNITLCDQVRGVLANYGLSFAFEHSPGARTVTVSIGNHSAEITGGNEAGVRASMEKALFAAGYPGITWKYVDGEPQTAENGDPILERTGADHEKVDYVTATFAFQLIVLMAALVYGPSAAFLSEYFHPRLRYLSVSLVYSVGTGWLGGLVPVIAATMVLATGNTFAGLWYVIAVALFSLIVSLLLVGGRKSRRDPSVRPLAMGAGNQLAATPFREGGNPFTVGTSGWVDLRVRAVRERVRGGTADANSAAVLAGDEPPPGRRFLVYGFGQQQRLLLRVQIRHGLGRFLRLRREVLASRFRRETPRRPHAARKAPSGRQRDRMRRPAGPSSPLRRQAPASSLRGTGQATCRR